MKKLAFVLLMTLAGCEQQPTPQTKSVVMYFSGDLKDCKSYSVPTDWHTDIIVVRCPNSTTSARYGKSGQAVTIE